MHIRTSSRLAPDARSRWIERLPPASAASAAIDLCEALQDSSADVSVTYVEVLADDDAPLALGLIHTIHGLDLASYIGGVTQRIFSAVGMLRLHPLKMDVAFLETPFCNLPGLFVTPAGERAEAAVVSEVVRWARANLRCDIFCVKTCDRRPGEDALAALGMLHAPFLANTGLALPFATFDEYLASLSWEWRRHVRVNQRRFAAANGRVTRVTDLAAAARITADLFRSTTSFHEAQGHMGRPLDMDEHFLRCLDRNAPPERRCLFMCEVDGQVVVATLAVHSGKQLIFVKAGLDYARVKPSAAYFNAYYAMIEFAIANGIEFVQLCAEAYDVKRRMGGTTAPVSYYVDINNRWISPIVTLIAKHFSGQKGSAVPEPA